MNPELSGFALGLLFGAAKILAIGTVGFGIAWWRARRRIRELEAERLDTAVDLGIGAIEERFEKIEGQLDRLLESHHTLRSQLTDGSRKPPGWLREGTSAPDP